MRITFTKEAKFSTDGKTTRVFRRHATYNIPRTYALAAVRRGEAVSVPDKGADIVHELYGQCDDLRFNQQQVQRS